jgi:hypothetical protein
LILDVLRLLPCGSAPELPLFFFYQKCAFYMCSIRLFRRVPFFIAGSGKLFSLSIPGFSNLIPVLIQSTVFGSLYSLSSWPLAENCSAGSRKRFRPTIVLCQIFRS